MKVALQKKYLDAYDLKSIVRAVHNLFDDYNYKQMLISSYSSFSFHQGIQLHEEDSRHRKTKNTTLDAVEKREAISKYLERFARKLEFLENTLTEDEMKIYKYSILQRLSDKEIRDFVCKTDKTYYPIKKSCYVKLALGFDLVDGFTKNVFETISLVD